MKAEIISCGTELLLGYHIDTNSAYLSNALSRIGIDVYHRTTVGDNRERLGSAITDSFLRSNITIVIGGLGPTVDDITMETLAYVTKRDLTFNKAVHKRIINYFKKRNYSLVKDAIKQALIPRGADFIINTVGTAPGLIIKHEKKHLIALPGPPRELIPMAQTHVIPYLKKIRETASIIKSRSLKLIGLPEVKVNEKVKGLLNLSGHTTVGIYTHLGEVELRITSKAQSEKHADKNIAKVERKIRKIFGKFIYGIDNETLQDKVGNILKKRKKTISIAESCTGGYLSHLITNTPGSSNYFLMGIIAYSNAVKSKKLGISIEDIKKYGAVSREVAKSMAVNIRVSSGSDIGLGITGIAGPASSSRKKPVGLAYIALAVKKGSRVKEFRFYGSREEIKYQAAQQALNLLRLNF